MEIKILEKEDYYKLAQDRWCDDHPVGERVKILIPTSSQYVMYWPGEWESLTDYFEEEGFIDSKPGDTISVRLDNGLLVKCPFFILAKCVDKTQFKPFDKVLMRGSRKDVWRPKFFSGAPSGVSFMAVDGYCGNQCIPYEGNEHLAWKRN